MKNDSVLAILPAAFVWVAAASIGTTASADVRLPKILSDHMVLQTGKPATFWGWADAGEEVTVNVAGKSAKTKAGADGKWSLKLELPAASDKPVEVTVSGKNTIKIEDVLIGEVWICSGQSNMAMNVAQTTLEPGEVAAANYPMIRHFKVRQIPSLTPKDDVEGKWEVCSPSTVGEFTGVGYYFGKTLQTQLKVPVGLLGSNWGGTPVQAWTSRSVLDAQAEKVPSVKLKLEAAEKRKSTYTPELGKEENDKKLEAWKKVAEKAKAEGKPEPRKPPMSLSPDKDPHLPANLYNGMIAPLLSLSIRGAIWYQGEANVGDGYDYREQFSGMIRGWRKDFGQGDFPFYFVQIAPYQYAGKGGPTAADKTRCAQLWDSQLWTYKNVPNTGMAVVTDLVDDLKDIHPKNKRDVGNRLALWALAKTYGKTGDVYSGPLYKSSEVQGNAVKITFDFAEGLTTRDGQAPSYLEIAGADEKFVPAVGKIDGNVLLVTSSEVAKPVAVRFAWTEDAQPNLVNGAKLPASPFRTDSFKVSTQK